jgi:hypothetical protein
MRPDLKIGVPVQPIVCAEDTPPPTAIRGNCRGISSRRKVSQPGSGRSRIGRKGMRGYGKTEATREKVAYLKHLAQRIPPIEVNTPRIEPWHGSCFVLRLVIYHGMVLACTSQAHFLHRVATWHGSCYACAHV